MLKQSFSISKNKWRASEKSVELSTHNSYLTDIITISLRESAIDVDSLRQRYEEKGLSLGQISKETFHSKSTIQSSLKRQGVKLRSPSQHHGNPSQLSFGYRKSGDGVVVHHGEQKIIQIISDYRAEGLTLRAVAKRLNTLRLPTKNGSYAWHPQMVKRILDRCSA